MPSSSSTPNFLLGKTHKLLHSSEFSNVFDQPPLKASHPQFLILAKPNTLGHPRIGLVVAKKNIRNAVDRNFFKRTLRESFRLNQHQLPAIDAIVLARRGAEKMSSQALREAVDKVWLKIIKKAQKNA